MLINNRFEIQENANTVADYSSGIHTKIEPRLMQLLLILIENKGSTVSRELLAKKVWDNYPGAEEGINQAISALRKLLDDNNKQLIQTLPKKGYCLKGKITESPGKEYSNLPKTRNHIYVLLAACLACLLVIAAILWLEYSKETLQGEVGENKLEAKRNQMRLDSLHQARTLAAQEAEKPK